MFTALVDCAVCETTFDGAWPDPSLSFEDVVDVAPAPQTCPNCGHAEMLEYPGWSFFSEA